MSGKNNVMPLEFPLHPVMDFDFTDGWEQRKLAAQFRRHAEIQRDWVLRGDLSQRASRRCTERAKRADRVAAALEGFAALNEVGS